MQAPDWLPFSRVSNLVILSSQTDFFIYWDHVFKYSISPEWLGFGCLMTPGRSKDIRCHVWPYFLNLTNHQITHMKWVVRLVIAYGNFNQPGDWKWSL